MRLLSLVTRHSALGALRLGCSAPRSYPSSLNSQLSALSFGFFLLVTARAQAPVGNVQKDTSGNLTATVGVSTGKAVAFKSGGTFQFDTGALFAGDAAAFRAAIGITGGAWGSITGTLSAQTDLQAALDAKLVKASNLSDLTSASTARTNLGLAIGTNVQAWDADLDYLAGVTLSANVKSILNAADYAAVRSLLGLVIGTNVQAYDAELAALAGLTSAADKGIQFTGSGTAATYDLTAAGKALLDDAAAVNQRTTLGVAIGTDVQAYDAELAALAGLTSAADKLPYFTGSGTAALADFTSAGRALVDDADAAAQRTTLGLGTLATQSGTFSGTSSGTNTGDQTITLTGDVTGSGTGSFAATLANIPNATPMAGSLLATTIAAPATPAAGKGSIYVDSTAKNLAVKDDAGVVKHGVQTRTATASNWIRAIDDAGATTISQPAFSDVSGSATTSQLPMATDTQARAASSTTTVIAPSNLPSFLSGFVELQVDIGQLSSGGTGGNGTVGSSTDFEMQTSATSGSAATYTYRFIPNKLLLSGTTAVDFGKPVGFQVCVEVRQTTANGLIVFSFTGPTVGAAAVGTVARLTQRGLGFEIRNTRLWRVVHDGTTKTATDTGLDVLVNNASPFGGPGSNIITCHGTGSGTYEFFLNGVSAGTSTGGPTGLSSVQWSADLLHLHIATDCGGDTGITNCIWRWLKVYGKI